MSIPTAAAAVTALLVVTAACAAVPEPKWLALEQPIAFNGASEFPFVPEHSGPHQVIIRFPYPIPDPPIDQLIDAAGLTTGEPSAPTFDFAWSILRDGTAVSRRDAPQRHTGIVDTHASGLGEGPRTSRGLVFGGCRLEAGRTYHLRLEPGAALRHLAAASPTIRVEYQPHALRLSQ